MWTKASGRFLRTPMRPSSTRKPLTMCSVSGETPGATRNGLGRGPIPLTGLMYCADCGGKMYVHRVTYIGKRVPQFTCGQYWEIPYAGRSAATQHRIRGRGRPDPGLPICSGPSRSIPKMTGPSLSAPFRKRRPPSRPPTYPRSGNGWPPPKSGPGNWNG